MQVIYFILISIGLAICAYFPVMIVEPIFNSIGEAIFLTKTSNRKNSVNPVYYSISAILVAYIYALAMATNVLLMHDYFDSLWVKILLAILLIYAIYWQQLKRTTRIYSNERKKVIAKKGFSFVDQSVYYRKKLLITANGFIFTCVIVLFWPENCPYFLNWLYAELTFLVP